MDDLDLMVEKKPSRLKSILKTLFTLGILIALYYGWKTGAILNGLKWLMAQDPILLTVVAVVGLIALALFLGGD